MLRLYRLSSSSRLFNSAVAAQEYNKTEENGIAHVTSINIHSGDRSIVEISKKTNKRIRRFRREFHLPEEAVTGLKQVLVDCKHTPKQLQHEADQLNTKLSQRKFPASPETVKQFRDEIKLSLRSSIKTEEEDIINDPKIKQAQNYEIRNKVDKMLKKSHFNWRPLEIDTKEAAAAYALARLTPNYAEIARCLEEIPNFSPKTVLDFGSGSGAGYWAVREQYPDVKEICLVDKSDNMAQMAMDIMRKENGELLDKKALFRRHLIPSLQTTYDLVIGHRFLSELGSEELRMQNIEALWARTNKYLLLIEASRQDSFEALLDVRDHLLISGNIVDKKALLNILAVREINPEEIINVLDNKQLTEIEKFDLLKDAEIEIPTLLPPATVVAPCPHDLGCPLRRKASCSFEIRWKPIRADGKRGAKESDGTETGNFSFVILEKNRRQPGEEINRLLKIRKQSGHATCDVCTSFNGIQRLTISKRAGELYKSIKIRRDGECFPLQMKPKATEGMFDLYEYGKAAIRSG